MFKTYKRKIHVYYKRDGGLCYAWSSHAYRTCRDAINAAKTQYPELQFVANFERV